MRMFGFSLAILLVTSFSSLAVPDELLFQPWPEVGKDASVRWWYFADTNYGDSITLTIFGRPAEYDAIGRSYVEFVELEPYVGSSYECLSATLSLFWVSGNPAPVPWLHVYRAAGPWEEDSITWNNQPGYIDDPCVYEGPYPEEPEWVDIDCVTEIVKGWFSGEFEHYGFVLKLVDENHNYSANFYSSDDPRDEKPKLYIEYQCTGVEPASLGEVKAVYR